MTRSSSPSNRQPSPEVLSERLRETLRLAEAGFFMQKQNLRRQFPDATDDEIDIKFKDWLRSFPPMSGVDLRVISGPEPGGRFPPEFWAPECREQGTP